MTEAYSITMLLLMKNASGKYEEGKLVPALADYLTAKNKPNKPDLLHEMISRNVLSRQDMTLLLRQLVLAYADYEANDRSSIFVFNASTQQLEVRPENQEWSTRSFESVEALCRMLVMAGADASYGEPSLAVLASGGHLPVSAALRNLLTAKAR